MSVTSTAVPAADAPFHIEQHGIDFIPESERWATPRHLFGMWAGASVQFEYLVYGALLMTFGFSFAQAVALTLVGNLSYVLLGICSLQGPDSGTTTFMINRASYGPRGSRLLALFNWVTLVGFETEGLTLIVLAFVALAAKAGVHAGTPLKVTFVVVAAALQTVLPFLGHATVLKVLRALIVPFVVLYVVLAFLTLGKAKLHGVHHGANWQTVTVGLAFVITLAGLGWVESGNDFSRYLPPRASRAGIIGWIFLGSALPQVLIMLLGAAVATYVPTAGGSPITDFPHAFAGWFLVPFLVVSVIQLFAINSLDLYSSGVTLQALGLRVKRYQAVLVDTVIAFGLTTYAVFSSSFSTLLQDFVGVVIAWIAPWMAIFLVDWGLRRWRYVPGELQRTDSASLYWRRTGIHWPAIVAQVLGSLASVLTIDTSFYVSPFSHLSGGADLSVFSGVVVGGLVYLLCAGAAVRREADAQDRLLAAA